MINQNKKREKGITLVTLSIAIIIMLIITTMLIYNISTGTKVRNLNNMYQDITKLKDKVDLYYSNYHTIPILETKYENTSHIQPINPNDNSTYYVIDLEALENIDLTYGKDYKNYKTIALTSLKDLYIINERSHSIYYVKGIDFEDKVYYTIPEENTKVELNSITNIENVKIDQNIAVLRLNAVNKENGIKQIKFMVNEQEYKTYEYTSDFKERKTEVLNIPLAFGTQYVCYLQMVDEEGNTTSSNQITLQNLTIIATVEDLQNLATYVNEGNTLSGQTVELINDIDLKGTEQNQWTPIGNENNAFGGNFNGNYHTISNLYMDRNDMRFLGLFSYNNGVIENLILKDCNINSRWVHISNSGYLGGIVGANGGGTIKNCAIVGNSMLSFDYKDTQMVATWLLSIGGISGSCFGGGRIEQCSNEATIQVNIKNPSGESQKMRVGGITATTDNGNVFNCYNRGNINIYSNGVYSSHGIAGIVAEAETNPLTIKNCYNLGTITISGISNSSIGAVVGNINSNNVTTIIGSNNYYNSETNLTDTLADAKAILSEQMKTMTFTNLLNEKQEYVEDMDWTSQYIQSYDNVWVINVNKNDGYPILKWQEEKIN